MDKLYAAAVLTVVVLILIAGNLYFKMDRTRAMANTHLKKLLPSLEGWLDTADILFSHSYMSRDLAGQYEALRSQYKSLGKKDGSGHVTLINELYALTEKALPECLPFPGASELGQKLSEQYTDFMITMSYYNESVSELNRLISHPINSAIAKVTRIKPMEKLTPMELL